MRRLILSLALTCLPVTVAFAGDAKGTPKLYVTNSTGNTIHVIDLTTFKVLAQIKTGDRPHGAAAAADCRTLFTTVESDNTLLAIDTRSDKIIRSVKLSGMPNQC